MDLAYVLWITNIALFLVILCRGFVIRNLLEYPVFYSFVAWQLVLNLVLAAILIIHGYGSSQFYSAASFSERVQPALQCLILFEVYTKIQPSWSWRIIGSLAFIVMVGLASAPILLGTMDVQGSSFYKFNMVSLPIQLIAYLLLYLYLLLRPDIRIGRNIEGVIFGMAFMVGAEALHFANLLFLKISFETFRIIVPATYTFALLTITWALWHPSKLETRPAITEMNLRLQERTVTLRRLMR